MYLIGRGWIGGLFLPNPIFEGPFLLPWCTALIAVILKIKRYDNSWGKILFLLVPFSVFAVYHTKGIIPPTPNKITLWADAFFLTENMAHACLYSGAVFAIYFIRGKEKQNTFHTFLIWGFVLYSIAQVVGAVWCYYGWGNTFRWGNRHMMSAAIWLYYAAYLHLRYMSGWDVRKKAMYAITGAVLVFILTFSGYLHEMTFPRIGG
ncbi:MAG: cytochrome c biogenesis protein CcsA [Spirochaetes bacterium]|nr:cytochrome c biogenesis protein CcsA [Spirochaetota bacterium]